MHMIKSDRPQNFCFFVVVFCDLFGELLKHSWSNFQASNTYPIFKK